MEYRYGYYADLEKFSGWMEEDFYESPKAKALQNALCKGIMCILQNNEKTKEADEEKGTGAVYERKDFGSRNFRDECI